jgi:uncharacterized membrane protein YcaP (DUF421 family)
MSTWTAAVLLFQWVTMRSRFASKHINGEPTIVGMNSKIMED